MGTAIAGTIIMVLICCGHHCIATTRAGALLLYGNCTGKKSYGHFDVIGILVWALILMVDLVRLL